METPNIVADEDISWPAIAIREQGPVFLCRGQVCTCSCCKHSIPQLVVPGYPLSVASTAHCVVSIAVTVCLATGHAVTVMCKYCLAKPVEYCHTKFWPSQPQPQCRRGDNREPVTGVPQAEQSKPCFVPELCPGVNKLLVCHLVYLPTELSLGNRVNILQGQWLLQFEYCREMVESHCGERGRGQDQGVQNLQAEIL